MVQLAFKWLAAFWLMPWRILSRWVTAFRNSLRQVFGLEPSVDVQRDKDGGAVERAQAPDRNEVRTRVPSHAGSFLQAYYLGYAGIRNYKVFIPPGYNKQPLPLVVMLHGCTQAPDDFALGTGMNALAATHQFFVVYPEQALLANGLKCWNWFKSSNQHRDRGEPAIIAGITQEVIKTYGLDATRVYVAGLSAGGAMAVIMGRAYPDLYAAVGVHSGIPYAAAHNANSAFAVMKGAVSRSRRTTLAPRLIPTIVLHGDNDKTVHPSNGETLARQFSEGDGSTEMEVLTAYEQTRSNGEGRAGTHAYTRTIARDKSGKIFGEYWLVHGAGHAWFGGDPAASHTDPSGPDASRAMSRFFLEHQLSPKQNG